MWFQATKCHRSPYYHRPQQFYTEVPLVTIPISSAVTGFSCTALSAGGSAATPYSPAPVHVSECHVLSARSTSHPTSCGSHAPLSRRTTSYLPMQGIISDPRTVPVQTSCPSWTQRTGHADAHSCAPLLPAAGPQTVRASFDRIRLSSKCISTCVSRLAGEFGGFGMPPANATCV